jgi:hypothetical protein
VFVLSLAAYAAFESGWWAFLLWFLAPDLSMLGYLAGPRTGAATYNLVHAYVGPAALIAVSLAGVAPLLAPGVIWSAHIGFDRMLGYGLKYPDGFGYTHLGRLGVRLTAGHEPD